MRSELPDAIQRHKDAIDDYLDTVRALYAFANSSIVDPETRAIRPDSRFCIPRRMSSREDSGATVTPDAVVQVDPQYGLVAEAKKHFPNNGPSGPYDQIRQYDRDLLGWWTDNETIAQHDLVLLTHVASSTKARDAYEEWLREGNAYSRPFAIVEFGLFEGGQHWYLLRRVVGRVSRGEHDEALRQGDKIQGAKLLELYEKYKVMDSEPPLMHMLVLVHEYVLPVFPTQEEFEEHTGKRRLAVEITVGQVRDRMEELFCPPRQDSRQFQLPRTAWVRKALEKLGSMELAARMPGTPDTYRVELKKPPRKDTIAYFAGKLLQIEQRAKKKAASEQPELF